MEVRIGSRDWSVVRLDPAATVADLAAAAGVPVDALALPPTAALAEVGLTRGATLDRPAAARPCPAAGVGVATVGGLDAGRWAPLPLRPGRCVVGRAAGADLPSLDPTVSRRHAVLGLDGPDDVVVADLGSRNGTWAITADGAEDHVAAGGRPLPVPVALRLGATEVGVGAVDGSDGPALAPEPGPAGTSSHNRPPRPAAAPPPPPVVVLDPPEPPGRPPPLGVVSVLAPLAMAALLVVLLGNLVFAVLALLAPVVAVGNHLEGRRRAGRTTRRARARRAHELARMAEALAAAAAAESERRRVDAPDLAEVVRRAQRPSTRLWERRPGGDDFLRLRVGTGEVPWDPPLAKDQSPRPADVAAVIAGAAVLHRCPATVDLAGGAVIGIVGDRAAALAVARSLVCQAAVHHGPADLPIAVLVGDDVDGDGVADWDWAKWLPHVEDPGGGGRWLARGRDAADATVTALLAACADRPPPLLVVDGYDVLAGRRAPVRTAVAGPAAGIVVAETADRLPSMCAAVVHVDEDGTAELTLASLGRRLPGIRADGVAPDTAARCARALARFEDPEVDVPGAGLPTTVRLLPLLDLPEPTATAVAARWRAAGPDPAPVTPLGATVDGVLDVDLAIDGPHALVAGTTGSGKSELLRTMVAGLAVAADPDALTFLLVDFKGGSAFDACGRLPHVVGLVTDLDDDLAERALRSLEAELRRRERLLRSAAAADLATYRRQAGADDEALPRLVVVIDEFATLKAELPDFVDALVGIAQRGRSLGVHLVLATQRPSGAVSDHIRANTNLRIALRVQDAADSHDVIDAGDAAHLPRGRPGRACVRLGPGEVVAVQSALATAAAPVAAGPPVQLVPFAFGPGHDAAPADPAPADDEPTDLDHIVDTCAAAWAASGRPPPRRPWLEPLPERLDRARLPAGEVALADDPDHQRQLPIRWRRTDGNLAVYGIGGAGTTTTLTAVALSLADTEPPDRLHLYGIDHGAGGLAVLGGLPHTGAVITAADIERQRRLVRWLRGELDRRRADPVAARRAPEVIVLIDGIAAFLAAFDDAAGFETLDAFERVFADGPDVGLRVALTADRPSAVPSALASLVRQRWVHRLADGVDASAAGVKGPAPGLPPGRFVDTAGQLVAHVGVPAAGWEPAVRDCAARWASTPATAPPVGELAADIPWSHLGLAAQTAVRPWQLPVGVADDDLAPAALPLWDGDHVLVAGPARSGRTTALATIAHAVVEADPTMPVLAVASPRSWLATVAGVTAVERADLAALDHAVVLVDDADGVDDPDGTLEALACGAWPGVHIVAAGRAEVLRGLYGHWTRTIRRSRLGLLLRPHLDLDGELLGATLPRRVAVPFVAGRGFLVADGVARLLQVARPDSMRA